MKFHILTFHAGERAYDGTRAADYTGQGLDGKLRLFVTKKIIKIFLI